MSERPPQHSKLFYKLSWEQPPIKSIRFRLSLLLHSNFSLEILHPRIRSVIELLLLKLNRYPIPNPLLFRLILDFDNRCLNLIFRFKLRSMNCHPCRIPIFKLHLLLKS